MRSSFEGRDYLVELGDAGRRGHGHEMVSPKPSDVPLYYSALLVGPLDARVTVEGVKAVVAAQQDEPLGLDAISPEQHPRDGRLQVVVTDSAGYTPQALEGVDVAGEERLLRLGGKRPVARPSRRRQS